MNPDNQKATSDDALSEAPQPPISPWQSSHQQPVVQPMPPISAQPAPEPKRSFGQRLKAMFKSPKFWLAFLALLIAAAAGLWFVQPTRWWLVNAAGARNTLTIATISPGEGKAKVSQLRNVAVMVNGVTYHTDSSGTLRVPNVPYGQAAIVATKAGFQSVNYGVVLDFDPFLHKFGGKLADDAARNITLSLKSTGIPVSFKVVDWLSGKPVTAGDFAAGDLVAKADDQGLVTLRVPGTDTGSVTVSASFGGAYVDKKFDLPIGGLVPTIQVVPGGRDYFLNDNSGTVTLYSSNLDGSDVQPIVTGTGQETDSTNFAVSPDGKYGVLSSSRDGAVNAHHNLLQRVYIVDLAAKRITRVDEGVNVMFADWSGDELIYTTSDYDVGSNSYPVTLRGVDAGTGRVYNFESADDISVSTVGQGKVLYQRISNSGPDKESSPVLREAPVNGTTSQTLGDQVNDDGYIQQNFDRVDFKTAQDQAWHEYNLNTDQLKTISQPTADGIAAQYLSTANSDGSKHLLVDQVDGQSALFVKDSTGQQTPVYGNGGLSGPIRWVGDDVVIYRVQTPAGAADYAVSLQTGKSQKITDVLPGVGAGGQRFNFY